jgi:hypothetical protein
MIIKPQMNTDVDAKRLAEGYTDNFISQRTGSSIPLEPPALCLS